MEIAKVSWSGFLVVGFTFFKVLTVSVLWLVLLLSLNLCHYDMVIITTGELNEIEN